MSVLVQFLYSCTVFEASCFSQMKRKQKRKKKKKDYFVTPLNSGRIVVMRKRYSDYHFTLEKRKSANVIIKK